MLWSPARILRFPSRRHHTGRRRKGSCRVGAHPGAATAEWAVRKRRGKVFVDYNQNARGKTLASIYSPRVHPSAAVSMPLGWDELGQVYPTDLTILTAPERLRARGDLWMGILAAKQDLDALVSRPARAAG